MILAHVFVGKKKKSKEKNENTLILVCTFNVHNGGINN